MTSVSSTVPVLCQHTPVEYIFADPLCEEHHWVAKIAIVALHVLTLGIPLGIYHFVVWIVPSLKPDGPYYDPLTWNLKDIGERTESLARSALQFADKQLEAHPHLKPLIYSNHSQQARDRKIALLARLHQEKRKNLLELLNKHIQASPWDQTEVTEAADALMRLAYVISNLTFKDIIAQHKDQGGMEDPEALLVHPTSYSCHTFFCCTDTYLRVRQGALPVQNRWMSQEQDQIRPHSRKFYLPDTLHYQWRLLFIRSSCVFRKTFPNIKHYLSEDVLAQMNPDLSEDSI